MELNKGFLPSAKQKLFRQRRALVKRSVLWEFTGALPNTHFSVITRVPTLSRYHIHFKTRLKCTLFCLFSNMLVNKVKWTAHSQVRVRCEWMRTQRSLSPGLHYALHSESDQWTWMILRGSNKSIEVLNNGWDHFPPLWLGPIIPGGARTLLPHFGKRNRWPGEGAVSKHSMDQWWLKQKLLSTHRAHAELKLGAQ